jgi:hypothetical protein
MRILGLILVAILLLPPGFSRSADHMVTHAVNVAGVKVVFTLYPSAGFVAVAPKNADLTDAPRAGDVYDFVHLNYDYKQGWKLDQDGRVTVVGTLWRRDERHAKAGISFLDVDRLISAIRADGSDDVFTKVNRSGRTWIMRTEQPKAGSPLSDGRKKAWLVPLREDAILIFRVDLDDYRRKNLHERPQWRLNAEAMQERIFESLKVE